MNIFFVASIAGKRDNLKNYIAIIDLLKKEGHQVFFDHIIKDNCDIKDLKKRKDYKEHTMSIHNLLKRSEIVVAEISHPSIMVGYLLSIGLRQRKYTLALYKNNPHRILVGDPSKFLKLKKYKHNKELKKIWSSFLKTIDNKSLNIRFNLMLDEGLDAILREKSKELNISKADYVRRLIESRIDDANE